MTIYRIEYRDISSILFNIDIAIFFILFVYKISPAAFSGQHMYSTLKNLILHSEINLADQKN